MDDRLTAISRKYLSLGIGELVAAAVFAGVAVFVVEPRLAGATDRLALWSALVPLMAVLVPAGAYWLLARKWVGRSAMPAGLARSYRALGYVDAAMLAAALVAVLIWLPAGPATATLVLATWLLGVVEYVNYFVVRLAYPVRSWFRSVGALRTPRLVLDIRGRR